MVNLLARVVFEDVASIKALVGEVADLVVEGTQPAGSLLLGKVMRCDKGEEAAGDEFPIWCLGCRELYGGMYQGVFALGDGHRGLCEALELGSER